MLYDFITFEGLTSNSQEFKNKSIDLALNGSSDA